MPRNFRVLSLTRAIFVTLIVLLSPVILPALASSNDLTTHSPRIHLKNSNISTNWGGYAVESNLTSPASGFFKGASASWVVPALACTNSSTYSAIWVGIDGYSSNTVEQIGTEQDCVNGSQVNYAWFEVYPRPFQVITTIQIHQGDNVSASVQFLGQKQMSLTIRVQSSTSNQSFSEKIKVGGNVERSSAEWIVEGPSTGAQDLANFGTVLFSQASFNTSRSPNIDHPINGLGQGTFTDINLVDPTGAKAYAEPSELSPSGYSFNVQYSG